MILCPVCKRTPLKGRQHVACSGRCRAVLARRRQVAEATGPLERSLVSLAARLEELAQEAREALAGNGR